MHSRFLQLKWPLTGVAIVALRSPSLMKPFLDVDEAVYASIAALSNVTGQLYARGGVDNKFPGIFWLYELVFRVFGQYSMIAVHWTALTFVLATAAALGAIAHRIGHSGAAPLAALFYGLLTTFFYPKMQAANTEIFAMLPISVAVLLSLPRESMKCPGLLTMFAAGVLVGVGTTIRQLAVLNCSVVCIAPLFWSGVPWVKRLERVGSAVLGFLIVTGAVVFHFAAQGTLRDFWFWTVTVVSCRYLPDGWRSRLPLDQLVMVAETGVFWWLALRRHRRWRILSDPERILHLWLGVGIVIVILPGRFHPHYAIQVFAPLAILSAMEFCSLEPGLRRWRRWIVCLLGTLAVTFGILAVRALPFSSSMFSRTEPEYAQVARHVRATTSSGERIFVWGIATPLYVMSDRLPASRFVGFMRGCKRSADGVFEHCWDSGAEMWPLLLSDLAATKPALIVDTASAGIGDFGWYPMRRFPAIWDILQREYSWESTIHGVDIYRRNSYTATTSPSPVRTDDVTYGLTGANLALGVE